MLNGLNNIVNFLNGYHLVAAKEEKMIEKDIKRLQKVLSGE